MGKIADLDSYRDTKEICEKIIKLSDYFINEYDPGAVVRIMNKTIDVKGEAAFVPIYSIIECIKLMDYDFYMDMVIDNENEFDNIASYITHHLGQNSSHSEKNTRDSSTNGDKGEK